jgi:branched-chain amino acid aminotransferase
MELAQQELGLPTVERNVGRSELYNSDEVFLCGTGAQISPVIEIDHRKVGTGAVGPITRQLQDVYFRAVRGEDPKRPHWVHGVYGDASIAAHTSTETPH